MDDPLIKVFPTEFDKLGTCTPSTMTERDKEKESEDQIIRAKKKNESRNPDHSRRYFEDFHSIYGTRPTYRSFIRRKHGTQREIRAQVIHAEKSLSVNESRNPDLSRLEYEVLPSEYDERYTYNPLRILERDMKKKSEDRIMPARKCLSLNEISVSDIFPTKPEMDEVLREKKQEVTLQHQKELTKQRDKLIRRWREFSLTMDEVLRERKQEVTLQQQKKLTKQRDELIPRRRDFSLKVLPSEYDERYTYNPLRILERDMKKKSEDRVMLGRKCFSLNEISVSDIFPTKPELDEVLRERKQDVTLQLQKELKKQRDELMCRRRYCSLMERDLFEDKYQTEEKKIQKQIELSLEEAWLKLEPKRENVSEQLEDELESTRSSLQSDLKAISESIRSNDFKQMENLVSLIFGSDPDKKFQLNILFIAAVTGTAKTCQYLLETGFKADTLFLHEAVAKVLSESKEVHSNVISPLELSILNDKTDTFRILIKHTGIDKIEKCPDMSHEMEAIFMEELCGRLTKKYQSLQPKVIAATEKEDPVLIVYTETPQREEELFCGIKVKFIIPRKINRGYPLSSVYKSEHSRKMSDQDMKIANQIINERGDSLWAMHSNLNIISMSTSKFTGGKETSLPVCITLYCTSKGIIPYGENQFPKEVCTVDGKQTLLVDVREGYFEFCHGYKTGASSTYHPKLKMGCSISNTPDRINGGGSLGPFVDITGSTGFLTCAHVLFNIANGKFDYDDVYETNQINVVQPADGSFQMNTAETAMFQSMLNDPVGHVHRAKFNPDLPTGIDAAVIQITNENRIPEQGQFAIKNDWNFKGLGFEDPPVFNSGVLKDAPEVSTITAVIKAGSETHLTKGLPVANGIQVRPLDVTLGLPSMQRIYPMKNQIEIASLSGHQVFFQPGDSGSAVFAINEDRSLECIGMAIGFTSDHTAVVTPIKTILEELGPGVTLKNFEALI